MYMYLSQYLIIIAGECRAFQSLPLNYSMTETILIEHGWVSSAKECDIFNQYFSSKYLLLYRAIARPQSTAFKHDRVFFTVYSNKGKGIRFVCRKNSALPTVNFQSEKGAGCSSKMSIIYFELAFSEEFLIVTKGGLNAKTSVLMIEPSQKESVLAECAHSLESPKELSRSTGGILVHHGDSDLIPTICGGEAADTGLVNEMCHSLSDPKSHRQYSGILKEKRIGAASLVIGNGTTLWVTGGYNYNSYFYTYFDSTEIVELDGPESGEGDGHHFISRHGPSLPRKLCLHCLAKVGHNIAILVGGYKKMHGSEGKLFTEELTWLVNLETMAWTLLAQMNTARSNHVCGVIKDVRAIKIVVAAGGNKLASGNFQSIKTVELLVIDEEKWEYGPYLPVAMRDASCVTSSDQRRMYVVGGITGDDITNAGYQKLSSIFELQCPTSLDCYWMTVYQMSRPMYQGLVFVLPADSIQATWEPTVQCPSLGMIVL